MIRKLHSRTFSYLFICVCLGTGLLNAGCRKTRVEPKPAASSSSDHATTPEPSNQPPRVPIAASSVPDGPIPDAGLPFSGPTFRECHKGFHNEGEPRKDVTRLGYLCGPYHGLKAIRPMASGTIEQEGGEVTHEVELKKSDCMRLFVVSGESLGRMGVKVASPSGTTLVENDAVEGWAAIAPYGVICGGEEGKYKISIRALRGRGEYAAQAWVLRSY